jgi:hypothetical protein
MRHLFLALWLVLVLGRPSAGLAESAVMLATTTSTQDTGLLDVLIPAFELSSACTVKTIAVGTGAALAMGEKGDADVLLVHAPKAEEAYMADVSPKPKRWGIPSTVAFSAGVMTWNCRFGRKPQLNSTAGPAFTRSPWGS